jgi:hypothetical protein
MKKNLYSQLITCILPKGKAMEVAQKLWHEKNITAINEQDARRITTLTVGTGETLAMETEILSIVVAAWQAEDIFKYIYKIADINQPDSGIIYLTALETSSDFKLPDLPIET